MIRLFVNFYLLSFARHPFRTLRTLARAIVNGVEETRYARWFRDIFATRRKWRRLQSQTQAQAAPCDLAPPSRILQEAPA